MCLRRRILAVCVCTAAANCSQKVYSQEFRSLLFRDDDPISLSPSQSDNEESLELVTTSKPKFSNVAPDIETETIHERFKDGKVRVERKVTLDGDQNYVNHGNFTEWSPKGDVVASGSYEMGKRQGAWIKFFQTKDAALFATQPYTRFKAPFQSSVEFKDDKMDGLWAIIDADHRIVSHILLTSGIR
jgi:hypothetical protein